MEKIIVKSNSRDSYPIFVGSKLFSSFVSCFSLQAGSTGVLITDDHVAPIYLDVFQDFLKKIGVLSDRIIIPAGESCKSLGMLEHIVTQLLSKNYSRSVILFALGGGVIGDLVGFTAAVYQRGVRFVQVPTTFLAQVDASVGGKTAVNHHLGKNMIGAFYQPISVIVNLDCLYTLNRREFSSGLAEVIKYSIAFDFDFFKWLECHLDDLLNLNLSSLSYCVCRCCQLKSNIVQSDEYDENGTRILLNLGHTYAHAIESYFKYTGQWLHGEAVSVGLMMSANLSYILGYLNSIDLKRIRSLLLRAGLPVNAPEHMEVENYLLYMMRDKKNVSDQLCLVLPVMIGQAKTCVNVKRNLIELSIRNLR